jgi:hypothetical protein
VTVACLPDNEDVILGYIVFQPNVLHYMFVKEAFRKFGIARFLYKESFGDNETITYTHKTLFVRDILSAHPLLTYNPFKLFNTGDIFNG